MSKIALFLQALELHGYDWNLEGFISSIPPELSYNWTDKNDAFETSIPNKIPLPSKANQELPADDTELTLNLNEIVLPISILLNLSLALLLVYSCVCKKKQETLCQCEQLQQLV